MKYVDIAVPIAFVVVLIILSFFWGCSLDLYVTILAGLMIVVTGVVTYVQHKIIKKLSSETEAE